MSDDSRGAAVRQEQIDGGGVVESTQGGEARRCTRCGHTEGFSGDDCPECQKPYRERRVPCLAKLGVVSCRYADEPESDTEPTGPIYRKLDPARVRFDVSRELAEWWHRLTGGDMKQALDELAAAGKLGVVVADVEVGRGGEDDQ